MVWVGFSCSLICGLPFCVLELDNFGVWDVVIPVCDLVVLGGIPSWSDFWVWVIYFAV